MSDQPAAPEAGTPDEPQLPVTCIEDALPLLRRPFAPGAVKWKVQSEWPFEGQAEGAIVVGYIDARLVSARLNKVVGGAWEEEPVRVADQPNALLGRLKVFDQTHTDLGTGQGRTAEMKLKAVHSDALKRPAVRFGIGEPIYAMPEIRLGVTDDGALKDGAPTIKRVKSGKRAGRAGYLSEAVEAHLRERYQKWLDDHGIVAFGAVLDHGDAAEGSVGMAEPVADDTSAEAPDSAVPLGDEEALALGAQARTLRDEIRAVDDTALAQQSFDAAMAQREHSHDRLRDFVGNLTELLADVKRIEELTVQLTAVLDEGDLKKTISQAQRRASRSERVDVLEKALAEAKEGDAK